MPIYEFQCDACGHCFEKLQKINDSVPECPVCKESNVRKLVSAPSFQLKGSGWYKSDYKKTAKPEENKSSNKTESGDNKKDNSSSSENSSKNNTDAKTEKTNNSKVKDAA